MYYLQSRYYDPAIGRFINADTFATTDANGFLSCNMFAYCENNPVNWKDSNGEFPWSIVIGGAIGAVAGGMAAKANGTNVFIGVATGALNGIINALIPTKAFVSVISAFAVGFGLDMINQGANNLYSGKRLWDIDYGSSAIAGGFSALSKFKAVSIIEYIDPQKDKFAYNAFNAIIDKSNALLGVGVGSYYNSRSSFRPRWNANNQATLNGKVRDRGYTK